MMESLTLCKRRLRARRVSVWHVVCIIVLITVLLIRRQASISSHNETMGKAGPAFDKILDDISWSIKPDGQFQMTNHNSKILSGRFGRAFTKPLTVRKLESPRATYVLKWQNEGETTVRRYNDKLASCVNVVSRVGDVNHGINPVRDTVYPTDCFDLKLDGKDSHWYGGAESYADRWPISFMPRTYAHVSDYGGYGSVLERYWFNSHGVGIFVENDVPLYLQSNKEHTALCFIAKYKGFVYENQETGSPTLNYTICAKGNVLDIHRYMSERFIRKPMAIPDENMITNPVWSTWVNFKSMITQDLTMQFVNDIVKHKFPASQIEIDDMYTSTYGDYEFDFHKFPKPKRLIEHIHAQGFRVTVWTHPFANTNSEAFKQGRDRGFFVSNGKGDVGVQKWWRGRAASLDVTNPEAVTWFFMRLAAMHELGVDGHKYDAGEIGYLPARYATKRPLRNPCEYSSLYAEAMYNNTNRFMQVRVGYKTQHLPVFVSMMDRSSSWSEDNGLRSVIATSLILSSIGYVFIMPDMIGGNAYCSGDMDCLDGRPLDRELYIRWVQLVAFLPMMQFSIPPWDYDADVTRISLEYVKLHADYVAPRVIALGKQATRTGEPIVRPMWWSAPDDPVAFTLSSQFMLGDDLVVAPILERGSTSRRVFLPRGVWKDMNTARILHVNTPGYYVENVVASLDQIPYFERVLIP